MKRIKCLALSMALVMGASVSAGNFVSASGTADKAAAEMESAMSGDARYSRLSELVKNIENGQKHYELIFKTVRFEKYEEIPGFNKAEEIEWANNMAEYSKELVKLATSLIQSVNPRYVGRIAKLFGTLEFAQEKMEEAAGERSIIRDCYGYARVDDDNCGVYRDGLFDYDPSLYPYRLMEQRDSRLKLLNECISKMTESAKELLKIVEESSVK